MSNTDKVENADTEHDEPAEPAGQSCHPMAACIGVLCFPCTIMGSCYCIRENNEAVILNCGKYSEVVKEPGIHFSNCWGREIRTVSRQKQTLHVPLIKIVDKTGNPLNVSGIVVFCIQHSKKAAIDVKNPREFTLNAAQTVLKTVVSRHPYEATKPGQMCLKSNASQISQEMVQLLQQDVNVAGVKVLSFQFNDLSYAPEIASAMLKRAQAQAMVAARKKIVDGALDIALGAVTELEKKGVQVDAKDKSKIVTNLLTVICSDTDAKPTVNVAENTGQKPLGAPKFVLGAFGVQAMHQ